MKIFSAISGLFTNDPAALDEQIPPAAAEEFCKALEKVLASADHLFGDMKGAMTSDPAEEEKEFASRVRLPGCTDATIFCVGVEDPEPIVIFDYIMGGKDKAAAHAEFRRLSALVRQALTSGWQFKEITDKKRDSVRFHAENAGHTRTVVVRIGHHVKQDAYSVIVEVGIQNP